MSRALEMFAQYFIFVSLKQQFEAAKAQGQLPFEKDGKVYNRCPPMPKQSPPYFQCHCSQMRSLSLTSTVGSTCPIKCLRLDGSPYQADNEGHSTCPICLCPCDKAFQVCFLVCFYCICPYFRSNFYHFVLSKKIGSFQAIRHVQQMTSGQVSKKKALEVHETQNKVTNAVMTSIDSTFAGHFNSTLKKLPMTLTNSETAQLTDEAWGQAAYNMARTFNCDDDRAYIRHHRNQMGMPSTLVMVDGKPCSTRALSNSFASHREINNKLGALEDLSSTTSKKRKPSLRPNRSEFENRKLPPVTPTTQVMGSSNHPLDLATTSVSSLSSNAHCTSIPPFETPAAAFNFATMPLNGYDRVMNYTASQIAHGTMSKLHMDVDAGTETIQSVVDPEGKIAGRRMRYMVQNKDIAESTCDVYGGLDLELGSQEIAFMLDDTWGKHYSQDEN
jgi:hypothetical protein